MVENSIILIKYLYLTIQTKWSKSMSKHDKVRDNLVNAARQLFTRFGFEKTTMNEIAMEARKGKSSLYYYFTSKEEVFRRWLNTRPDCFTQNWLRHTIHPMIFSKKSEVTSVFGSSKL